VERRFPIFDNRYKKACSRPFYTDWLLDGYLEKALNSSSLKPTG
jgi:hypothetical protein